MTVEPQEPPLYVEDWDFTICLLSHEQGHPLFHTETGKQSAFIWVGPVGMQWRKHAAQHLADRLQRELRAGLPPRFSANPVENEALIIAYSVELESAANNLFRFAERMKNKGDAWGANQAMQASRKAKTAAADLKGTDA